MFNPLLYLKEKAVIWSNKYVHSQVTYKQNLSIGKNSTWNYGCWINAMGKITIGDNVIIGPYCIIHSGNHKFENVNVPIREQGYEKYHTVIEDDCWLGANVIVLPGVHISKGSIIGAGSVVTKDIPQYTIAVGNPAKVIKNRKID
jgi:acetyltransferase-like isoleucine patch superfamily enzyme